MNISNLLLIILAVSVLWMAINLDRSSQQRITSDQNSQLNDSMEFLRGIKNKSANERSKDRRINAYRKTVERTLVENPENLKKIEENFNQSTDSNSKLIENVQVEAEMVANKLTQLKSKNTDAMLKSREDNQKITENLKNLAESISSVNNSTSKFEENSAILVRNIAEVKEYLG